MALTFASYLTPGYAKPLAVAAVVAFTVVNYFGVTKTAGLARILLALTLIALAAVLLGIFGGSQLSVEHLSAAERWTSGGVPGTLQAAGLLFFAFAGYARIATMGEEVRDPQRTIPRAIPIALAMALVLYAVVGIGALLALGPTQLAASTAPLVDATKSGNLAALTPAASVGAAVASLGALLALIHPRYHVPHRAEIVLGIAVCALVLILDRHGAIGFSSFGVLVYYAITNAAAFTLPAHQRHIPRWLTVLGLLGCLTLAAALPWTSVLAGLAVFTIGLAGRAIITSTWPGMRRCAATKRAPGCQVRCLGCTPCTRTAHLG